MHEFKRNDNEQLRQVSSTPRLTRVKQYKDNRQRILNLRPKEVFLTDTQTDQTKSSNDMRAVDVQKLEYNVQKLEKENKELKDTILKMKATQFYGINEEKVKNLIKENQTLQKEIKIMRKELDRVLIEKDFLQRNNKALKAKYEELAKQSNKLVLQGRLKTENHHFHDYELLQQIDQFMKENNKPVQKQKRSISNEKSNKIVKRKSTSAKIEEKMNFESKKLKENSNRVNEHYYIFTKSNKKGLHS